MIRFWVRVRIWDKVRVTVNLSRLGLVLVKS